jgi:hypothetical protein
VFFKIGKLLNSLQYHINKNIDETLYQNKVFLSSKWNFLQHNILRWSQRHSHYIFLTVILAILSTINLVIWKDELAPIVISYFPYWRKLIEWQGSFLAGQLTIVGVVYPLVIGLIGVLFQNKSAKKTLFPIYQMYSGFMFAGLSGLFLSVFIIAGFFMSASFGESTYLAICLITALWLTFNVLLTSWFFTATFLMLDETKRDRLIVRFTIHELCEIDIRHRLRELLLQNAVQQKILVNPDEAVLKVSTYKFSDNKYDEIVLQSKDKTHVTNVYFSIINAVIHCHLYRLKILNWFNKTGVGSWLVSNKGFNWLKFDFNAEPEIVVQPMWKSEKQTGLVLVRYAGFNLGWFSRFFIKASFKVKYVEEGLDKSLTSMMIGFVGTANDAIREKNIGDFKYALENIVKWHVEIASALSFLNDNKEEDNWLLLQTSNFFSRSYLDEILSEYYRISKAAVELIPENIAFFDEVIYLHKRLFSRRDKLVKREGFSLIQGSYFTWSLLMEWRSYSSTSADMRIANKYEDVLFDFVGSWESWLDYIEPRSKRLNDLPNSLPLFLAHMELTAHTSISALRYNNAEAAGWGVDMLNNWIEKLSVREHGHGLEEYRWHSELVTHDMLLKSSDNELWQTALNGKEFNLRSAFNIALSNAAFDLRIITACYILLKPNSIIDDQVKQYVKALLSCAAIHPTGSIGGRTKSVTRASDILGAYIRHRDYPNYGEGSYGSWLSKVLESFGRVNEKRRVSGRIYLGWGRDDPQSMNSAYVEIAVSFSTNEWQLERKWFDIIFSNAFRHIDHESLVRDLNDWLKVADEMVNSQLISHENHTKNIENFKTSIQIIIQLINEHKKGVIAEAEIDEALLTQFGVIFSEQLNKVNSTPDFPINLFDTIGVNGKATTNNSFKVNIQEYKKENVAVNVDINRAVNEEDWLKDATNSNIKTNILRAFVRYQTTELHTYTSAENNVNDCIKLSKSIRNPVLFVGDDKLSRFLYDARYNQDIANKYGISFIDGHGRYYICSIGNIEVYEIRFTDVEFSLLTTKELFEAIDFTKVAENQFVKVKFEASEKDESIGVLSLNYWMDITFKMDQPCIKFELKIKDEE